MHHQRALARGVMLAFAFSLSACGQTGSTNFAPAPPRPSAPLTTVPAAGTTSTLGIGSSTTPQALPSIAGVTGTIVLSGSPATSLSVSAATAPPSGVSSAFGAARVPQSAGRRARATTNTGALYYFFTPSSSFTISPLGPITITFPAGVLPANVTGGGIGLYDSSNASAGFNETIFAGTTLSGNTLSYPGAGANSSLSFQAGVLYVLGIYYTTGTPATSPSTAPSTSPSTAPTTSPTTAPTTSPTTAPTTSPSTAPSTAPTGPPSGTTTQFINPAGGTVTFPAVSNYTGSLGYPSNNAQPNGVSIKLTTSVNNASNDPTPANETVVYFLDAILQSTTQTSVTFNSGAAVGALASPSLDSAKTYTAYYYIGGQLFTSQSLGHPTGGTLSLGSPFIGVQVPVGTAVTVEIATP